MKTPIIETVASVVPFKGTVAPFDSVCAKGLISTEECDDFVRMVDADINLSLLATEDLKVTRPDFFAVNASGDIYQWVFPKSDGYIATGVGYTFSSLEDFECYVSNAIADGTYDKAEFEAEHSCDIYPDSKDCCYCPRKFDCPCA